MSETVNHPAHYNVGSVEVIDAIEAWDLNFNLGNAVKYIARADHKGKPIEDLLKAQWYIEREITRRTNGKPDVTVFKFRGNECHLFRDGDKFALNECGCLICDVCAYEYLDPEAHPCEVCCHGDGEREYFKLDERKVEIIK